MASDFYKPFLQAALTGGSTVDLLTVDVQLVLVDSADYTVNLDTHDFLADIPAGARIATSTNFSSKTFTNNVFDAADVSFTGISGDQFEAAVIVAAPTSSPTDANTRLVFYIDTASGLPFTPNGGNIDVTWNASGIFEL